MNTITGRISTHGNLRDVVIAVVTGDRNWTDGEFIERVLCTHRFQVLIEGECRGVDVLARDIAQRLGIYVDPRPADWDQYGPAAGPIRNQEMVDLAPDICLAFHDRLHLSRGTVDMMTRCRAAGIHTIFYSHEHPHGRVVNLEPWYKRPGGLLANITDG